MLLKFIPRRAAPSGSTPTYSIAVRGMAPDGEIVLLEDVCRAVPDLTRRVARHPFAFGERWPEGGVHSEPAAWHCIRLLRAYLNGHPEDRAFLQARLGARRPCRQRRPSRAA